METIVQEVETRTRMGKKTKALRREGITPANIYGSGIESVSIQASTSDLEKMLKEAGGTRVITLQNSSFEEGRTVLVKGVTRDIIKGKLLHVDFYNISLKDKVKVEVPIGFEGEAPATSSKDMVMLEGISSVEVECLPTDIPDRIMVDISGLSDAGDLILVSDITLDNKVTMLTNPDDVIARVEQAKAEALEDEDVGEVEEATEGTAAPAAEEASSQE